MKSISNSKPHIKRAMSGKGYVCCNRNRLFKVSGYGDTPVAAYNDYKRRMENFNSSVLARICGSFW